LSIRNIRQRTTSKHTVNANELGIYALPGSCRFGICISWG